MSIQQIESAVEQLPPSDLAAFIEWFENFVAAGWDTQLEKDICAGKLDRRGKQADEHFDAGRCTPL